MKGIALIRTEQGFAPANEFWAKKVAHYKVGAYLIGNIVQPRDGTFHRLAFAMLQFGFDYWHPPAVLLVDGIPVDVDRNFEVYRKNVTVQAGYYDVCAQLDGSVKLEPQSISYESMEEGEFREWFFAVKEVLWTQIFSSIQAFDEQSFENIMLEFMRF